MNNKELRERVRQLEFAADRAAAQKRARQGEFFAALTKSIGEGYLVLPTGKIIPVVISNCDMRRDISGVPLDVTMTVHPQPPE